MAAVAAPAVDMAVAACARAGGLARPAPPPLPPASAWRTASAAGPLAAGLAAGRARRHRGRGAAARRRGRLHAKPRHAEASKLTLRAGQWHPGSELEVEEIVEEEVEEEADEGEGGFDEDDEDNAYSCLGTHREMIEDKVRTEAFRRAIFQTCPGKVVLEVGCGTGILSVFAAQAGATRVVAVEANLEAAAYAEEVVEANGLQDVVSVLTGRVESLEEEVGSALLCAGDGAAKADVIISEWMGFALVCEDMFPSVAFARERWLREGGAMLPAACSVVAAPFNDEGLVERMTGYWNSKPYGVDLSALAGPALDQHISQPVIATLAPSGVLAEPAQLWRLDCETASGKEAKRQSLDFDFQVASSGAFHGLAVWFDCELCEGVGFSTGPEVEATHWEQTLLFVGTESPAHGEAVAAGQGRVRGELRWLTHGSSLGMVLMGEVTSAANIDGEGPVAFARRLDLHVT